ncbi:MAG TPA: tyrosine-type recombinase/integrase [Streptosporangiaceae bacterium]|nr:tyrosine-type recombinase/integrase [Streptosporangiaceae bacterium]
MPCAGRSFARRRDTAIIALTATGIRLSELASLRCDDIDLWQREITVRGKGRKNRIGYLAARSLDQYLRAASGTTSAVHGWTAAAPRET